jgi:phosphatidylglycerol---prolipoprotein diacylglyceryl transferase
MQSELLRIPYEWNGVPIFGVGVLLAIWALASVAILAGLVRRHGWSGETWSTVPVLLFVGAAILVLPRVFPGGMPIRGYGVMLLAGISAGIALAIRRAQQVGLDHEIILSLTVWLVVAGVVGARLFYVIEYWEEKFAGHSLGKTLAEVANVPEGGLVVYGGLIGAAVAFILFVRKYRLPLLPLADIVAPSLAIGLALGRVGCFLNGCCYGGPSDFPWAVTFPKYSSRYEAAQLPEARRFSPPYADQAAHGELYGFQFDARENGAVVVSRVENGLPAAAAGLKVGDEIRAIGGKPISSLDDAERLIFERFVSELPLQLERTDGTLITIDAIPLPPRSRPVHPAQLYSAIDAALLCWLAWSFYPFRRRDGQVIALLLTIHPVTRFLLEIIRTDEPAVFGTGLSISQNISLVVLVIALGLWWYTSRRLAGLYNWSTWSPESSSTSPAARAKPFRTT